MQTYLTHMLARRGSFPDFTLFMQPDAYDRLMLRMRKLWIPETGIMGLGLVRHTRSAAVPARMLCLPVPAPGWRQSLQPPARFRTDTILALQL